MTVSTEFGKCLPICLLVGVASVAASCSDTPPSGQVIAEIDGEEVTLRELQQDIVSSQQQNGARNVNESAAFEGLIDRKILTAEALRRGLDQDGAFHFALRQERERLLVEALQRDLEKGASAIDAAAIEDFIDAHPWRFGKRFVLSLTHKTADGQRLKTILDSWDYSGEPPEEVMRASEGDLLEIAGEQWTSAERQERPIPHERAISLAGAELRSEMRNDQLRQIITNRRQSGQIRYQDGYGPAAQ